MWQQIKQSGQHCSKTRSLRKARESRDRESTSVLTSFLIGRDVNNLTVIG